MRVIIELKETSQPLIFDEAINTYTKGPMFCVYDKTGMVSKFPLINIWRIREDYGGTK